MESINPSPCSSTHQSDSGTKETPFAQAIVHLTKQQYIQLKWNSRYWQRQRERAITREAALKLKLAQAEAEATIRDLTQRLYGKQSEKSSWPSEAQSDDTQNLRVLAVKRGGVKAMAAPRGLIYRCFKNCMFYRLTNKSAPLQRGL